MRNYESIVVYDPNLGEEQLEAEISKTQGVLQGAGASSVQVDKWGRREIAYVVRGSRHGHFVLFRYESESPEIVNALRSQLSITETVKKYYSVRTSVPRRKFKGRPVKAGGLAGEDVFDDNEIQY